MVMNSGMKPRRPRGRSLPAIVEHACDAVAGKALEIVDHRLLALMGEERGERLSAHIGLVIVEERACGAVHRPDVASRPRTRPHRSRSPESIGARRSPSGAGLLLRSFVFERLLLRFAAPAGSAQASAALSFPAGSMQVGADGNEPAILADQRHGSVRFAAPARCRERTGPRDHLLLEGFEILISGQPQEFRIGMQQGVAVVNQQRDRSLSRMSLLMAAPLRAARPGSAAAAGVSPRASHRACPPGASASSVCRLSFHGSRSAQGGVRCVPAFGFGLPAGSGSGAKCSPSCLAISRKAACSPRVSAPAPAGRRSSRSMTLSEACRPVVSTDSRPRAVRRGKGLPIRPVQPRPHLSTLAAGPVLEQPQPAGSSAPSADMSLEACAIGAGAGRQGKARPPSRPARASATLTMPKPRKPSNSRERE